VSSSAKTFLKRFLSVTGLNELAVKARSRDLLVLCYHGIVARPRPDRWSYENWDPADLFRSQLEWLRQNFEPADLDGVRRWREGAWNARRPPVLVTFDDGYRNNLTVAAPILRELGTPAVIFLATSYIGAGKMLWNDEVRSRVTGWRADEIRHPSGEVLRAPGDAAGRRLLAERINRACKALDDAAREEYLGYLRRETDGLDTMDDPEARAFLTWDEARQLSAMGFEIGSHTVNHPILSRVEESRADAEVRQSKHTIERELGAACRAIAYPNGTLADVNEAVFRAVRSAGYEFAFTTVRKWAKRSDDPHRLPRVGFPGHTDLATFQAYASGLA
jgi:peptidoglycan/xylan/chitin deacetylase (PgdA/CDA1 family)